MFLTLIIAAITVGALICSIKIVPQQERWIVERFGKYKVALESGLSFIIPLMDRVAYKHMLKERAINVAEQTAITKDNVTLVLDGVIYVKITNPFDASYGIENPYYAVTQLAQTSMRSAIGKIAMDTTFEERDSLNAQIVATINDAAITWGIQCMRYEIRDIKPPTNVVKAMETQVAAERQKRADILGSEGKMQSIINVAEGQKREVVLSSEAEMQERINSATGEAEAIRLVAKATADSIRTIANAMQENGGQEAVAMKTAEKYIDAFKSIAKKSNTLIIPTNGNDVASVVAQAFSIFNSVKQSTTAINASLKQARGSEL